MEIRIWKWGNEDQGKLKKIFERKGRREEKRRQEREEKRREEKRREEKRGEEI